jgi:hypothetical protein
MTSKQMRRRSRYVATSTLCLGASSDASTRSVLCLEERPMLWVNACVGSVIKGPRVTASEMGLGRPPGDPPGTPPGPPRKSLTPGGGKFPGNFPGPGAPPRGTPPGTPPGDPPGDPPGTPPGDPILGPPGEALYIYYGIPRPPRMGVPEGALCAPPGGPPRGGVPRAPGGQKSAHFFGYLITLPVGTVWSLFFGFLGHPPGRGLGWGQCL